MPTKAMSMVRLSARTATTPIILILAHRMASTARAGL
jgi:hypothetical protein